MNLSSRCGLAVHSGNLAKLLLWPKRVVGVVKALHWSSGRRHRTARREEEVKLVCLDIVPKTLVNNESLSVCRVCPQNCPIRLEFLGINCCWIELHSKVAHRLLSALLRRRCPRLAICRRGHTLATRQHTRDFVNFSRKELSGWVSDFHHLFEVRENTSGD